MTLGWANIPVIRQPRDPRHHDPGRKGILHIDAFPSHLCTPYPAIPISKPSSAFWNTALSITLHAQRQSQDLVNQHPPKRRPYSIEGRGANWEGQNRPWARQIPSSQTGHAFTAPAKRWRSGFPAATPSSGTRRAARAAICACRAEPATTAGSASRISRAAATPSIAIRAALTKAYSMVRCDDRGGESGARWADEGTHIQTNHGPAWSTATALRNNGLLASKRHDRRRSHRQTRAGVLRHRAPSPSPTLRYSKTSCSCRQRPGAASYGSPATSRS